MLIQNARAYAAQHQLAIVEPLGFGIHGIIFVAELNIHMVDVSPSNIAFPD